jgi:hypothetical protein
LAAPVTPLKFPAILVNQVVDKFQNLLFAFEKNKTGLNAFVYTGFRHGHLLHVFGTHYFQLLNSGVGGLGSDGKPPADVFVGCHTTIAQLPFSQKGLKFEAKFHFLLVNSAI